ncbi:Transmembrane protein 186 [Anthophora plagiata]
MNFLRTYSYTVQRYCSYNSINGVIRRCSHIIDKQECDVPPKTIQSKIYPDYKIIYKFPYIVHASLLNKVKRNYLVFVGASVPVFGILTIVDSISVEYAMSGLACSFGILATMHIICKLCNNLIGVIYYKEDDNKVIISYLNYWGKRVDLLTDVNDVILQETILKITPLYEKLYVRSHKKYLKVSMKFGNIIEKSIFPDIFTG